MGSSPGSTFGAISHSTKRQLLRVVRRYGAYYNTSRTHLALGKDPPESRPVQAAEAGAIVAVPQAGGLHHRYERRMAA